MTQQSLITRLKAVEEALADVMWAHEVQPSCQKFAIDVCRCEQCATERSHAALSDLRELIKEAEGQQEVAMLGITYAPTDKPLYTALGEKPAAAEQQQAKEKKE